MEDLLHRHRTGPQLHHRITGVFSSNREDLTLETIISDNHPYPAPTPPELLHVPSGMARTQFRAMGTTISLLVPVKDLQRGEEIVRTLFDEWEQTLSRFIPESGLSQLNRLAGILS
jgi:FAD:protein FMN transferase